MVYSNDVLHFIETTPWALDGAVQGDLKLTITNEAQRLKKISGKIKFSMLCPLYNTDPRHLRELLWSCLAQTWDNWELILVDDGSPQRAHIVVAQEFASRDPRIKFIQSDKNGGISAGRNVGAKHVSGDYVGILDHDDLIHPQALGAFGRQLLELGSGITFIYSNECKISDDSKILSDFFYKPDFCKSTLLRSNYIAHLTFLERSVFLESKWQEGIWYRSEYDGAEDHEFFLRVADHPRFKPCHIPLFTYLWRKAPTSTSKSMTAKPYVFERAKKMITEYLEFRDIPLREISPSVVRKHNRFYMVELEPKSKTAKPLVVVPFKDNPDLTIKCLESVEAQTLSSVVVLANNNSKPESVAKISGWTNSGSRRCTYHFETIPDAFDYAHMNNFCVEKYGVHHDYLVFLNNDVELKTETTFEQMVAELEFNSKIGLIGMRLYYPGHIETQHGGIKIGPVLNSCGKMKPCHIQSHEEFASDQHVAAAITFAAAMCKKTLWQTLNGLEPVWLPNGFGDVDFCLRASKAGFRNFYLGSAEGIHHESKTRLQATEELELWKLYARNPEELLRVQTERLEYDPFHHQSMSLGKPLRYEIADQINQFIKKVFRPLHSLLKLAVKR